jgi:hypothetical protein
MEHFVASPARALPTLLLIHAGDGGRPSDGPRSLISRVAEPQQAPQLVSSRWNVVVLPKSSGRHLEAFS